MEVVLTGSQKNPEQPIPQSINHSVESQQMTSRNTAASVQNQRQQSNVVSEITRPSSSSMQKNRAGTFGIISWELYKLQVIIVNQTFVTTATMSVGVFNDYWLRCDTCKSLIMRANLNEVVVDVRNLIKCSTVRYLFQHI